jgi:anaerobic magnesium-protoporphyrin IX monomethyl ester cyclase
VIARDDDRCGGVPVTLRSDVGCGQERAATQPWSQEFRNPKMEKKARVALISLYSTDAIGLRYLNAMLAAYGYDVSLIFFKELHLSADMMTPPTQREYQLLMDLLRNLGPDLVGISLRSTFAGIASSITRRIRRELSVPVIWGGTHPTVAPEDSIRVADMICIGEGEYPLLELLQAISSSRDYTSISNLWVRRGEEILRNDVRPLITDLDSLPVPEYGADGKYVIEEERLTQGDPALETYNLNIMASRGCPYHCSYCCNSVFNLLNHGKGPRIRRRTVENVMKEIQTLLDRFPRVRRIDFIDEVFAWDKQWTAAFIERYKKEVNLPFQCAQHPNIVDREVLRMLRDAGLERVEIGVQSGSERIRKEYLERPVSDEQLIRTSELLKEIGLVPFYDFIIDNPYETETERKETLDFLLKMHRPFHLHVFSLKYFPGTVMTRKTLEAGLISEKQVEGNGNGTEMSRRMFVTLKDERAASDRFWVSLYSLVSKSFVPKALICVLAQSGTLKRHPGPLVFFADLANKTKLGLIACAWLFEGKPVLSTIRATARRRGASPII